MLSAARSAIVLWLLAACAPPPAPMTKAAAATPAPAASALTVADILALQANPPPAAHLTVAQARRDVDILRYLMERAYIGALPALGGLPRATIQDLDAVRAAPPLEATELCRALDGALAHIADAHLRAVLGGPWKGCARPPAPSVSVGKNLARAKDKTWSYEERRVADATVGILAISQMDNSGQRSWQGIDGAIESALAAKSIVIDLRGNGGGDDTRGLALAARLLDSTPHGVSGRVRTVQRTTPEAQALWVDTVIDMLSSRPYPEDRKASLADELVHQRAALRKAIAGGPESVTTELGMPGPAVGPAPYRGTISVLVDSNCASACEITAFALAQHPRARLVGRQTSGFGQFSFAMNTNLPNSGIRLTLTLVKHQLADGRPEFPENKGLAPNVVVNEGEDALDVALASP